MSKLSNLWAELKLTRDVSKKMELQKEINRIEQYCIDNGFAGITALTVWHDTGATGYSTRHSTPGYPENAGAVFINDIN